MRTLPEKRIFPGDPVSLSVTPGAFHSTTKNNESEGKVKGNPKTFWKCEFNDTKSVTHPARNHPEQFLGISSK